MSWSASPDGLPAAPEPFLAVRAEIGRPATDHDPLDLPAAGDAGLALAAVDQKLWPVALLTVLGHLTKLHLEGRAHKRDDGGWEI